MVTIARQRPADRRNVALPPLATDSRSSPRFRAFCVGDRIEYFRGNPTSVIGSIVPMRWIVRKLAIETAPLDEDIALRVTDGRGGPYTLRWPCRRTASGWINSRKGTPLEVTPVSWRPYDDRPSRLR
jgi:hypothetical protein